MREEISWKEYLSLRPRDLKKPEYKHLWLLLFWTLELVYFTLMGRVLPEYHPVICAMDGQIPFLEGFVLPYLSWFVCIAFTLLYTLRRNVPVFRRFSWYVVVTFGVAGLAFLLWPSTFPGRPVEPGWPASVADYYAAMPRKNLFTWMLSFVYFTDPPRNVFPSEHVVVALGMLCAALQDKRLRRPAFAVPYVTLQLLICVSVVFVKQHSILDVFAALPLSLLGILGCFVPWKKLRCREKSDGQT